MLTDYFRLYKLHPRALNVEKNNKNLGHLDISVYSV